MPFLRYLMSLSLVAWIGGILFFAFVMAPVLFSVLPSRHLAASVVSPALSRLHWIGIVSGLIFLASSLVYSRFTAGDAKLFAGSHIFVALMLVLTCISQFAVTPRMAAIRAQTEAIDSAPEALRSQFDALHVWSTRLESGVLLLGLVVVYMISKDRAL
jgi:uncharacterized membrane protein